jgi:hypothetical protein
VNTKRNDVVEDTVHIGFRVPTGLAADFGEVAAENERTVSAELRQLMRQHVADAKLRSGANPGAVTA